MRLFVERTQEKAQKAVETFKVFIISSIMISINHPLVSRVECLRKKPWYLYSNVFPFIPFYVIAISTFWKVEQIGAIIILCSVAFIHVMTFLMCIWSFRYRIHVRYRRVGCGLK